jgi:hypothetical protein
MEENEWETFFVQEAAKALAIKSKISNTDYEINRMVYELYGLTEEEIRIVEGTNLKAIVNISLAPLLSFLPNLLHPEHRCLIILIQVICRNSCHIPVAFVTVVWRHNFNPCFVAAILYILVKLRV